MLGLSGRWHLFPPSGEVVRICSVHHEAPSSSSSNNNSTALSYPSSSTSSRTKMLYAFAAHLAKSTRLMKYITFSDPLAPLFSIDAAVEEIARVKRINNDTDILVFNNMVFCLHAIRLINIVYVEFHSMKRFPLEMSSSNHRTLLEALWTNLRPGETRSAELYSAEWEQLGFQGSDPLTDFRGAGMLGLVQLVYFSQHRAASARMILASSLDPQRRYFPFAVTGINITAFLLEMLEETRLHQVCFNNFEGIAARAPALSNGCALSDHPMAIKAVISTLHDLYCAVYEEFYLLWTARNPVDIMAFSTIFRELKKAVRAKYKPLSKKEQEREAADAHLENVAESRQATLERSFASFGLKG